MRIHKGSDAHLRHLCNTYNYATNPSIGRTEHEHLRCSQMARACRRVLSWYFPQRRWTESESGRLYPLSGERVTR